MLPVLIFSLILLSASSVVSHPGFEAGIKNILSSQLSSQCYKDVVAILDENQKSFKDLEPIMDLDIALKLPRECLKEIITIFLKEAKVIEKLFRGRNERSVDLLDAVPHQIVVEWKKLQEIIANELPKDCRKNLKDILEKNKQYFKHLLIETPRPARSVELQEMIDSFVSIPKHLCNFFSNAIHHNQQDPSVDEEEVVYDVVSDAKIDPDAEIDE